MRGEGGAAPSTTGIRPVVPALSAFFAADAVLVLIAGFQLFVLSPRTDHYFAWTIAVPVTAAADGAFYLASIPLFVPAIRARAWAEVRPLAWGVLAATTLKLVATLLHTSLFHFGAAGLTPRTAAWAWLIVYIVVPIAFAVLIAVELRMPGGDPPVVDPMPPALRISTGVVAAVLLLVGVALLLAPTGTAARWPWPLTTLTAQALSAWFVGMGVLVGLSARDGDRARSRNTWIAMILLCVLQGVAIARYSDVFDWGSVTGILYVVLFACVGLLGVWGLAASPRPARA